jgi:flagellar biosynthesis protein
MNKKKSQPPTAIALQYDPDQDHAPRVTAAGQGELAARILASARQNKIPIHPDPFLAHALAEVSISSYIPPECYALVAEILAYVYRIQTQRDPKP